MTYEALQAKAQKKADETGNAYFVAEDYSGYKVVKLTEKTMFSVAVQDIYTPNRKGNPL